LIRFYAGAPLSGANSTKLGTLCIIDRKPRQFGKGSACCSGGIAEEFAPDCILQDVMMPGMDGPSVLKALRQMPACAHIPAIIPWRVNSPAHSAAALPHFRALAVRPWCSLGLTTRSIQPGIQDGTA